MIILQVVDGLSFILYTVALDISGALGLEITLGCVEAVGGAVLHEGSLDHLLDDVLDIIGICCNNRCSRTFVRKADIAISILVRISVDAGISTRGRLSYTCCILDLSRLVCAIVILPKRDIVDDANLHTHTGVIDVAQTLMQALSRHAYHGAFYNLTRL